MSLLGERIALLENDLTANPPRVSVYRDLPFAIFRYDPEQEWALRREAKLLATRLGETGRKTCIIHLSELLWSAIRDTEGIEAVVDLEKNRGFLTAQEQLTTYLSDRDWRPLSGLLTQRLQSLVGYTEVVFLMRAAAMAPGIYYMSKLLDQMQGKTSLKTILFYPGSIEGTTGLRFMGLKDRDALGNYRVKIYG
ncbi:MAG: BREX protein BrxB domain-containing protein [Methanobacteriota archaeon]